MRVTNEQLEDIKNGENYGVECDEVNDTNIHAIVIDLLEARELIKEMRDELESARMVMEKYESQLTGDSFNDPSLNAIIDKSREYAE